MCVCGGGWGNEKLPGKIKSHCTITLRGSIGGASKNVVKLFSIKVLTETNNKQINK